LFIQSELYKSSGFLQESQEFLKLSNFTVKKMNEIQEEEEDSSLSNYKIDELPRFQKSEVSGSSFKGMEIKEETMKEKTTLIYQAVLEKFKGYNPYSTYSEMVLFLYKIIFFMKKLKKLFLERKTGFFERRKIGNRFGIRGYKSFKKNTKRFRRFC